MANRPELLAPPEIFYDETEARKYTSSSRIVEIQAKLSARALKLLALPEDGVPRFLLDIGLRSGVIDGAISISALQWLCNADKSSHEPRLRLKAFFGSLYRCLSRGARAVFQVYPENIPQLKLIAAQAAQAGFGGGLVFDDYHPRSTKKRKVFLVLTCGPVQTSIETGKNEYDESCSEDDNSEDGETGMVSISDRNRPRKKQRTNNKKGKGREWILRKKEQSRRKGNNVPADSKYTGRKRKSRF